MDLHRHTQFSLYDGSGTPEQLAKIAKEKGYTFLGISDHGTTSGLVQHYYGCKKHGIKPIMGVEAYHMPVWDEENKKRGYHLCLFAKNLIGYQNINKIITEAENYSYYSGQVTLENLRKHSDGIIATTACLSSFASKAILAGKPKKAIAWLKAMKEIFGPDLYIELQPYKVDNERTQENVNMSLLDMGDRLGIKCILTSDSHRGRHEDFDSYIMMWKMKGKDPEYARKTYGERYMPEPTEMYKRFVYMHGEELDKQSAKDRANEFFMNIKELERKVEDDILDQIELKMPKFPTKQDTYKLLQREVKEGLKRRGKYNKQYITRAKEELKVIHAQGFDDYFLIVQDYVRFAKDNSVVVGPGRGSVCNCLVAYILGITEVDSIKFGLDFNRFMRMGKNKIPDIDLDFHNEDRYSVFQHIAKKYEGHSVQISSYGLFKTDILINDLIKVCFDEYGQPMDTTTTKWLKNAIKNGLNAKEQLYEREEWSKYLPDDAIETLENINQRYDNIIDHFYFMYEKIRYLGTHAAGVAITDEPITNYTALVKKKVSATGKIEWFSVYDLVDLEMIKVVKFDLLGLKTLNKIKDLREATGNVYDESWLDDKETLNNFNMGNTPGVFQFDRTACQDILRLINCDCFNDVVATNAMNRPSALSLKMPEQYAAHKLNQDDLKDKIYYPYVKDTYGCIIYQEQVLAIAINVGGFTPDEADILVKMEHNAGSRTKQELDNKYYDDFKEKFVSNAVALGVDEEEATMLFDSCAQYGFNKGHSTGYSIISFEECYHLTHNPAEYFFVKIKYAKDLFEQEKYCSFAFNSGIAVFTPHINHSEVKTSMKIFDGEQIIQKGLSDLKNVGESAANFIINERLQNGKYKNIDDFIDRCKGKAVTKRTISILQENGCCEMKKEAYYKRVKRYNSNLYRA